MHTESIPYTCGDTELEGYIAYESAEQGPMPAVLIVHPWKGLDDFCKDKAEALAKMGYLGFAVDLYGDVADNNERAAELMAPLYQNRKLLRERILAGWKSLHAHPLANSKKMAAIGFCFGGLTVIELLRSGADLQGFVSFHGIYGSKLSEMEAKLEPNTHTKGASVLLLQGYEDPFLPEADVLAMQKELNDAKLDWQMHIFGKCAHAFTNPKAEDYENGMYFIPTASRRAWQMMHLFLEEVFNQ